MELHTVGEISKIHGVSTRMLRYYEQCGLITSKRKEGYSYRVYDGPAVKRLQQVVLLRKLQIPVKQIRVILNNPDAAAAVEIFKMNIEKLDGEITALSTIKKILQNFVGELETAVNVNLNLNFLSDGSILEMAGALSLVQKNIRERVTMEELNHAAELLDKLRNIRIRVELAFNGNCGEAIALYEKAFGVKCEGYGGEEYVEHVFFKVGSDPLGEIGMHDRKPGRECVYGDGVSVSVGLDSAEAVRAVYEILRDGGETIVAPEKTYFMDCYCEVKDRFGVNWILMY